jgi:heat shock protein HslJ
MDTVVFTIALCMSFILPLAAVATADGPDRFRVVDVRLGNSLNIRSGPSVAHERIGRIPAGTDGLINLGCEGGLSFAEWQAASLEEREASRDQRWCKIEYDDVTGWVAGRYLGESQMAATAGQTLHSTAWQLKTEGVDEAGEVWIVFSETGKVSGSTGCNRFNASFESSDSTVMISVIAMTRMACLGEERASREADFVKALEEAARFTATAETLTLRDEANAPLLTLERRIDN